MNNYLISILGDLHIGWGSSDMLDSQLRFIKTQFLPYLIENKIKIIFQTGDFFDNRRSLDVDDMNKIIDLFDNELKEFEIYIWLGNHDVYYKNTNKVHSLKFLSKYSNVHIIENITQHEIYERQFLFVPWLYDLNLFKDYLDRNDTSDVDVVLGHFDILGSLMNKSVYSKSGLGKEMLKGFKQTFSGHYHSRSVDQLSETSELNYVGSPYQLNRGDSDEERGFHILNCKDLSYEFIENATSIKFVSFNYPEEISEEKIRGNIVDVYINDTSGDIDTDKVQEYIESINKFKPIQNPTIKTIENFNKNDGSDMENLKVKSLRELFMVYLDGLNLEEDVKDNVYSEIESLYEECQKSE